MLMFLQNMGLNILRCVIWKTLKLKYIYINKYKYNIYLINFI